MNTLTWVLTFRGGEYTRADSSGDHGTGTYRIDLNKQPPHFDLSASKEGEYGPMKMIYQCQGDTLKMAWSRGAGYPMKFQDQGVYLGIYKRVK